MHLGERIRELRESESLLLRELAASLEIDTALLSKIERDEKTCKKEHITKLESIFKIGDNELQILWLADKIRRAIEDEEYQNEAIRMVQKELEN